MNNIKLCSGIGRHHTDRNKPLNTVGWDDVTALVDNPQDVEKPQAQWFIPSTLLVRAKEGQESGGEFWAFWLDIDDTPPAISVVAGFINVVTGGCRYEVYTSKSATIETPKSRVLIPLAKALTPSQYRACVEVLNDKLEGAGIKPDRSNEGISQLCFLPNKGEHYEAKSNHLGAYFDPLTAFSKELAAKDADKAAKESAIAEARRVAELKRPERLAQGFKSPIEAFNAAYLVEEILEQAGYDQRGDKFRHPNSESGSFSASVKDRRVHTLSSADLLWTGGGGGGAHDPFSAFTTLMHSGDQSNAIKDACDNWLHGWEEIREGHCEADDFESVGSALELLQSYAANGKSTEMRTQMNEDEYALDDIAIMGQWTTFYAAPNTGKTLLTLWMLMQQVQAGKLEGQNVYYVNADDNFRGAVEKLELLERLNIQVLIPNQNNFDNAKLTHVVTKLTQEGGAMGVVIVLDTLKKFTDLMDKKAASEFGKLARSFVGAGGTIITLAHTNKNRNDEGKRVFGGTSDILDDCDCGYVIDGGGPDLHDQYRAVFEMNKSRGDVAQKVTFRFTKTKGCTYEELLSSFERLGGKAAKDADKEDKRLSDIAAAKPVVDAILLELADGELFTKEILAIVQERSIFSRNVIKKALIKWAGDDYDAGHRWTARKGESKNQVYYQKLDSPIDGVIEGLLAIDRESLQDGRLDS